MTASPKYANLVRAGAHVRVPATVYLDDAFFRAFVHAYDALDARLQAVLVDVGATLGGFVLDHSRGLQGILAELRPAAGAEQLLDRVLAPVLGDWRDAVLAVRSAAPGEDLDRHSAAGLYASFLDVRGSAALADAVLAVWKSFFTHPAVIDRLRSGSVHGPARMHVMVQRQVPARIAGVAFTVDPVAQRPPMVLEYVEGLGDALVSGAARSRTVREHEPAAGPHAAGVGAAFAAARALRGAFGAELDIEWAWDGDAVTVLQVRPITTTASAAARTPVPTLEHAQLYLGSDAELEPFQPLPEFAAYFRNKRRSVSLLAAQEGLTVPAALVLRYNGLGLADASAAAALLARFTAPRVVLDADERVRQIIIAREELLEQLGALVADPQIVRTAVVRDYIVGEVGVISRRAAGGGVMIEYSADGLLALNRGTAAPRAVTLAAGVPPPAPFAPHHAEVLRRVTLAAERLFGTVQLEWVLHGDALALLDYSLLGADFAVEVGADPDRLVISRGYGQGPLLVLGEGTSLRRISESASISLNRIPDAADLDDATRALIERVQAMSAPPIVVARRPYAALAVLAPHAAGFVFEAGSLLSHLAIVIREQRIPAVASEELYNELVGRDAVDAAPGQAVLRC